MILDIMKKGDTVMKRWLYIVTLFTHTYAFAHIGNKVPNHVEDDSSSSSLEYSSYSISSSPISEYTASSETEETLVKISKTDSLASSPFGKDSLTNIPVTASRNRPGHHEQKNPSSVKKTKAKKTNNRGKRGKQGKIGKRGRRGKKGEPGEKGEKGEKGDPCVCNGASGFISALSVGFSGGATITIAKGENIRGFNVVNNSGISYNPVTGIFVSDAGPGFYEIHYGASWNSATGGQTALVLRVDGQEVNPYIDPKSQTDWARESIIVSSTSQNPTFALGNALGSSSPMILTSKGSYSSAFITIRKL